MIYFKENTAYSRLFYTEIIIHNTHMGVRGNSRFISSVTIINNLTGQWWREKFSDGGAMFLDGGGYIFFMVRRRGRPNFCHFSPINV